MNALQVDIREKRFRSVGESPAVVALRDALVTANRIVEVMARPGGSTRSTRKNSLFVQVSEIELATANLLHGLARLRRTLSD